MLLVKFLGVLLKSRGCAKILGGSTDLELEAFGGITKDFCTINCTIFQTGSYLTRPNSSTAPHFVSW